MDKVVNHQVCCFSTLMSAMQDTHGWLAAVASQAASCGLHAAHVITDTQRRGAQRMLSVSMGLHGNTTHPEVEAGVLKILEARAFCIAYLPAAR